MAIDMMDDEPYPKTQLKKAEQGLKEEKTAHKSKSVGKAKKKGKAKVKTNNSNPAIITKPTKQANFKRSHTS